MNINNAFKLCISLFFYLLAESALAKNQEILWHYADYKNEYPNEISFCIVDLKYDGQTIKICEFGEGIESEFKGYDKLYGAGSVWKKLWSTLNSFGCPLYYIDKNNPARFAKQRALQFFNGYHGHYGSNIYDVGKGKEVRNARQSMHIPKEKQKLGSDLLVWHTLGVSSLVVRAFLQKNTHYLVLGKATTEFVRNKEKTSRIFTDPFLKLFRPSFGVYSKGCSAALQQQIKQDIPSPWYVIKPVCSSCGRGIIIIDSKDLGDTLQTLFGEDKNKTFLGRDDECVYWRKQDGQKSFLIEAYAPSKILAVDEKQYDPTMRVIFVMANIDGIMQWTYLGAYWKLPSCCLAENGSLTQQHKSSIRKDEVSSVPVDGSDLEPVCKILNTVLPLAYDKMMSMML